MADIVRTTSDGTKVIFRQMTPEEREAEIERLREKTERDELSGIRFAYEQGYRQGFEAWFKETFGRSVEELDPDSRKIIERFYKEECKRRFKERIETGFVEKCREEGKKEIDRMIESGLTIDQIWKILMS
ncbi:MAG: hypothetical protein K2N56_00200 [Oscillospiraceae bacterium]|nr:hypothetical protein [Oscillospiraceae bacterium]